MKEVAVIGAGASGLAAMRSLIKFKEKVNITAFELSDRVGGLWVNRDPHRKTAMYDNLRTNLPKEITGFIGFPFPSTIKESFVSHEVMLEYMESFAKHFSMHQYIKFRHKVVDVDPFTAETGEERWYVTVRNEETGAVTTRQFDAVMVCNGIEKRKHFPNLEGMKTYPGEIIHSFYYQSPDYYSAKTVLIIGSGFSALDILLDMLPAAKRVYLSHHSKADMLISPLPARAEYLPDVSKIEGEDIILKNGRIIQADVIIMATGYKFAFPFLSERCRPEVKDGHVTNIYRMMVDIKHPSLYYIGLNHKGLKLKQANVQSELAVACITGRIPAVSEQEMRKEYDGLYRRLVTKPGKRPEDFHNIIEYKVEYMEILAKQSLTDQPLEPILGKLYPHVVKTYATHLTNFKEFVYKIINDDDFEIVHQP